LEANWQVIEHYIKDNLEDGEKYVRLNINAILKSNVGQMSVKNKRMVCKAQVVSTTRSGMARL
jgi:hypothetical protein